MVNRSPHSASTDAEPRYVVPGAPAVDGDGVRSWAGCSYSVPQGFRPVELDARVPPSPEPVPAVLWIHGGGWQEGDRRRLPETLKPDAIAQACLARGLGYIGVDYRLSGEVPFPGALHDVKAAVRYVRHFSDELGIDGSRLGAWGESAGGHLVAMLATTAGVPDLDGAEGVTSGSTDVAGVVDWYGVHDFDAMAPFGPDAPEVAFVAEFVGGRRIEGAGPWRLASPIHHVSADGAPMLLIHGEDDVVVPIEQSEMLLEEGTAAGMSIELRRVPGADHIFRGHDDVPALVAQSADWLAELLRSAR